MTTLREWKERRPASDLKQTIVFLHPNFTYRTVNNLFMPADFGGAEFEPARFSVAEPTQEGDDPVSMVITFVQASERVREILKSWRGAARMTAISCTYQLWDAIGDGYPLKTWSLFVKDISADGNNVTINAGVINPLTQANPIIYTTELYPGLKTS